MDDEKKTIEKDRKKISKIFYKNSSKNQLFNVEKNEQKN